MNKRTTVHSSETRLIEGVEFRKIAETDSGEIWVGLNGALITPNCPDGTYRGADNGHGYKTVQFTSNGRRTHVYVHRVVFETFVGPIPAGMEIDHINGNRGDNRLENLRVVSHAANQMNPLTLVKLVRHLDHVRRQANEVWRKCVVGFPKKGGDPVEFISCTDAAEFAGVTMSTLSTSLHSTMPGKRTAGGYYWYFASELEGK